MVNLKQVMSDEEANRIAERWLAEVDEHKREYWSGPAKFAELIAGLTDGKFEFINGEIVQVFPAKEV